MINKEYELTNLEEFIIENNIENLVKQSGEQIMASKEKQIMSKVIVMIYKGFIDYYFNKIILRSRGKPSFLVYVLTCYCTNYNFITHRYGYENRHHRICIYFV